MREIFSSLFLIIFFPVAVIASPNDQIHKLCLEARDYKGCVKAHRNKNIDSKKGFSQKEKCWGKNDRTCIANEGTDFLGMPKIVGWKYVNQIPDLTIWYFENIPRKVKVRGEYGRYIEIRAIKRMQFSPQAGTPGTVYGGGQTDCFDSGYGTFSCSSSTPIISPGTPSTPGGIGQILSRFIIDCEDNTYQRISKGDLPIAYGRIRRKSKWVKLSSEKANWQPKEAAKDYCKKIDNLAISDFRKYE